MVYAFRSAQEIVALYRSGEARPSDVVEETLGRIDALNPTLNAFLTLTPEIARAQAARADAAYAAARRGGDPAALPPLLGGARFRQGPARRGGRAHDARLARLRG